MMIHPSLAAFDGRTPDVADDVWVAPGAHVVGDVVVGRGSSIWFSAVLRADGDRIVLGAQTNVQDGCVLHTDPGRPVHLGDRVTVGHRAVVHGCTVGSDSLVGMGAVLLNGCEIGAGSMVAAGAVILEGAVIPPGSLVAGVPAKVRRELTTAEQDGVRASASTYVDLARRYAAGHGRSQA